MLREVLEDDKARAAEGRGMRLVKAATLVVAANTGELSRSLRAAVEKFMVLRSVAATVGRRFGPEDSSSNLVFRKGSPPVGRSGRTDRPKKRRWRTGKLNFAPLFFTVETLVSSF